MTRGSLFRRVKILYMIPALSIFLHIFFKISPNWLIFHMHVSDDSSNKFCKFDEIWRTLKRCGKFVVFLGLTDGIFMKNF